MDMPQPHRHQHARHEGLGTGEKAGEAPRQHALELELKVEHRFEHVN